MQYGDGRGVVFLKQTCCVGLTAASALDSVWVGKDYWQLGIQPDLYAWMGIDGPAAEWIVFTNHQIVI
jgi:hypothetical protein